MRKIIDLSSVLKRHKEGWVALSPKGNVVASASTLKDARQKAQDKGYKNPTLFKSVPTDVVYVG